MNVLFSSCFFFFEASTTTRATRRHENTTTDMEADGFGDTDFTHTAGGRSLPNGDVDHLDVYFILILLYSFIIPSYY